MANSTITQTASGENTISSTQQSIHINLTAPVETDAESINVSGYVSRDEVASNTFNIAYVVDTSGSMDDFFAGSEQVSDHNNDGFSNTLLDGAITAYEQLNQSLIDANLAGSVVSLIEFYGSARVVYTGTIGEDADQNGVPDVNDALRSLYAGGSTNFEAALSQANTFFDDNQSNAENYVFFISDGEPTSGGSYDNEVATLFNQHGATIRALGLGESANIHQLDFVDDGVDNDSAIRVLEPSQLTAGLTASPVDEADISHVDLYVNDVLIKTIAAADLISTAFGLSYETTLNTLDIISDDTVKAIVVANDASSTFATAALTIENPTSTSVPITTDPAAEPAASSQLFLDVNDSITLFDNIKVFGASGQERIGISGQAGAEINQGVERIEFNEVLNNYTFQLNGNVLSVRLDNKLAAEVAIQGDGTKFAFQNGAAEFALTGLGIGTLGGAFVDANDKVLSGVVLDPHDVSSVKALSGISAKLVTINAVGVDNFNADSIENVADTDASLNFAQGSYNYIVENFANGDELHFSKNMSLTVTNSSGSDGELLVQATNSAAGTTVSVTLQGISSALDSTIFDVNGFTTAFGIDSLTA